MKITETELPGVLIVEPDVFRDDRGFFLETYHRDRYVAAGLPFPFVQDNHSRSCRGTLRGLHAQSRRPQGKLVRAVTGELFDVAVDIRRGSPTFARWVGVVLSEENRRQVYIPPGFAHGFCVLSAQADVDYKCTDVYDPGFELALLWSDPEVGIRWPVTSPLLSRKDAAAPTLRQAWDSLPAYVAGA